MHSKVKNKHRGGKRRSDLPALQNYKRGKRASACVASRSAEFVEKNMMDRELSSSAIKVKISKLKTWDVIASKIGMARFTENGALRIFRILGFSGYRSSCSYVDLAVQRFI